jgi:predicted metal-dependent hydrolase
LDLFEFAGMESAIAPPSRGPALRLGNAPAETVAERPFPEVVFVRNLRAKHYRLTLKRDGTPVATIPARGSERQARAFVKEHATWLQREYSRHQKRPRLAAEWMPGTSVMWRGEMVEIKQAAAGHRPAVALGADTFRVADLWRDLRPTLEGAFKSRARIELTARTWELAAETGMDVKRVTIRNQRTRWGSCTQGGVISLNWRLILAPVAVSDYVILHELMHLREMNHSRRFWQAVAEVCPEYQAAESWLDQHGPLLGL